MSNLSARWFHDEAAAFEYVEARLWPNGPVCPFCGATSDNIGTLSGETTRPGLRKCYGCRKNFTVRIGSVFEQSHFPLRLWLQAIHLLCSSKKGCSTRQLQRTLGCSMKTAWHLSHRIREMMAPAVGAGPVGGSGKTVEADEAFIPGPGGKGKKHNQRLMTLVERGGSTRSLAMAGKSVAAEMYRNLGKGSRVVTDGGIGFKYPPYASSHETVAHAAGEYVRGDVHVNSVEGFFSVFKRGLVGVYQQMAPAHLDRYLAEFDFRQNTREKLGIHDEERTARAVAGAKGKRLTYDRLRGTEK